MKITHWLYCHLLTEAENILNDTTQRILQLSSVNQGMINEDFKREFNLMLCESIKIELNAISGVAQMLLYVYLEENAAQKVQDNLEVLENMLIFSC